MSKFHVFGSYWKDLERREIYSRHIEASDKDEAEAVARKEIFATNYGLGDTEIVAYPE